MADKKDIKVGDVVMVTGGKAIGTVVEQDIDMPALWKVIFDDGSYMHFWKHELEVIGVTNNQRM
jgi:hypothetical protein